MIFALSHFIHIKTEIRVKKYYADKVYTLTLKFYS